MDRLIGVSTIFNHLQYTTPPLADQAASLLPKKPTRLSSARSLLSTATQPSHCSSAAEEALGRSA